MFNWMDRKSPSEGAYLGSITRFRYLKRKGKKDNKFNTPKEGLISIIVAFSVLRKFAPFVFEIVNVETSQSATCSSTICM